jgi:hypothetical protein
MWKAPSWSALWMMIWFILSSPGDALRRELMVD